MKERHPPRLAAWLLDRLGYLRRNPALAGDLQEEFLNGRSGGWYWRQAFMVIATGIARNASVRAPYLDACLTGFSLQLLAALLLWWLRWPAEVHGVFRGVLLGAIWLVILIAAGSAKYLLVGPGDRRLLLQSGAEASPRRSAAFTLVAFDNFSFYLLIYCFLGLYFTRLAAGELIGTELFWLAAMALPILVLGDPKPTPESAEKAAAQEAAVQEDTRTELPGPVLCLKVALSGGRVAALHPETIVADAFAAGDPELNWILFRKQTSRELLRRAIWLGCARNYLAVCWNPRFNDTVSLTELAGLIETARARPAERALFDETRWERLRRRFGRRAA
jgi:hypothetical protein